MSIERELKNVWEQLRGSGAQTRNSLLSMRVQQLRGIHDLTMAFRYPVSVIAGTQGTGKSTLLLAAACAYKDKEQNDRALAPSTFFPSYTSSAQARDELQGVRLTYNYIENGNNGTMTWAKNKSWGRSFAGRKNATPPQRAVFIRTLANMANPSEIRKLALLDRGEVSQLDVPPALIAFAERVLPFKYNRVLSIKDKGNKSKELLFAYRDGGFSYRDGELFSKNMIYAYSEFHMSGGERALLRLSRQITGLEDALVLIDEIETGLHPYTQQLLMLQLQRAALRQKLQIIVTTHSPAILDMVPPEARIFLDRTNDDTVVQVPSRDILEKAFYGRSFKKLSFLCEDEAAEAIIWGVLDLLIPKLDLKASAIEVGRDTGKDEFPGHVRALAKFNELDDFVFVLDGDARDMDDDVRAAAKPKSIALLFTPGDGPPEGLGKKLLSENIPVFANLFGQSAGALEAEIIRLDQLYSSSTAKPVEVVKYIFSDICNFLERPNAEVLRAIAREEAKKSDSIFHEFIEQVEDALRNWRMK